MPSASARATKGRNSQGFEKCNDGLVAGLGLGSEAASSIGQKNRAIGLGRHPTLALQPLHGANDCYVSHAKGFGDVGGACLTTGGDKVGDGLHIILGALLGVLLAVRRWQAAVSRPF